MNLLEKAIKEASQKYYTNGTSDISDMQFDKMLAELKKEKPDSPLISSVGHGYVVNEDSTPGQKVAHKYGTVAGLDKCHNYKELPSELKGKYLVASLKLDGMSVIMYYENGLLKQALTRGVNNIGIDITDKVQVILGNEIKDKEFTGAVRGEIIMTDANFRVYSEEHPEAKNSRNSAVGIAKSKELSPDLQYLDIVVYSVIGVESNSDVFLSYFTMQSWLSNQFKLSTPTMIIEPEKLLESNLLETMEMCNKEWIRFGYPSDGVVLTNDIVFLNDNALEFNAIAFKFKAESAVTKVIGVEWNLSKTKYLVPRIKLETVQLSGTSVSWCTGFNAKYIADNCIGEGAEVEIYKSGEIIPYLDKVISPGTCDIPKRCPCCGSDLQWKGVHLICPERECSDSDIQDVLVWVDNISPWDGLGDTLKLKFLSDLLGEDNISISNIYENADIINNLDHSNLVKQNEFNNMMKSLLTNKVELYKAIQALNIPRFGDVNSRKLSKFPELIIDMMNSVYNDRDDDMWLSRVGEANFKSLKEYITKMKRLLYIKNNIEWTSITEVEDKGKVAVTGKLSVKRSDFEEELRKVGYSPSSISKDTKFLITDDSTTKTSKNVFAAEHNIPIMSEMEFRSKYM